MTIEKILKKGYTEYKPSPTQNCDRFFQKRVSDNKGIKYFIDIEYFAHVIHSEEHEWFTFVMNYEKDNYHVTARFGGNENLEEMEKILEDFFIYKESAMGRK